MHYVNWKANTNNITCSMRMATEITQYFKFYKFALSHVYMFIWLIWWPGEIIQDDDTHKNDEAVPELIDFASLG